MKSVQFVPFVEVVEEGHRFATGEPVTFPYMRSTEKAPFFGERFQQTIEPAGRYMLLRGSVASPELPGWQYGTVTFRSPIVLAFNADPDAPDLYNETSWKALLSEHYGATGGALSDRLLEDGYDGVVTVWLTPSGQPSYTKEIVQLPGRQDNAHDRLSKRLARKVTV